MLRRLYDKKELTFSLILIGVYIVLFSLSDSLSESIGIYKIVTAAVGILSAFLLVMWTVKNGLTEKCGLAFVKIDFKRCIYFLPLLLLVIANFSGGIEIKTSFVENVLFIVSMIAVGILEELIFRGFLFKALLPKGKNTAILISSITFGIGHIINLLSGAELLPTLLQICYAAAAGFLFTVIFYKTGSLYPCIITHCLVNALSIFSKEADKFISALILIAVSLTYAWLILKKYDVSKKEKK